MRLSGTRQPVTIDNTSEVVHTPIGLRLNSASHHSLGQRVAVQLTSSIITIGHHVLLSGITTALLEGP
jgi:hypothetical protein